MDLQDLILLEEVHVVQSKIDFITTREQANQNLPLIQNISISWRENVDGPQNMLILMAQHQRPLILHATQTFRRRWDCCPQINYSTPIRGWVPSSPHWPHSPCFSINSLQCPWWLLATPKSSQEMVKERSESIAILLILECFLLFFLFVWFLSLNCNKFMVVIRSQ